MQCYEIFLMRVLDGYKTRKTSKNKQKLSSKTSITVQGNFRGNVKSITKSILLRRIVTKMKQNCFSH